MRIRRIEIANFRKLLGPVALDGLGDGLTVIAGDNEDGKSTVLAALRSAFFDRYNLTGEGAKAMQPFGSALRPEISLEFEFAGQRYSLRKAFCQAASAELRCSSAGWTGPAAEEELQRLLRFTPPGRGPSGPEHRGVHGMFWVEQGTAFRGVGVNAHGRRTLLGALEGEVGQVLGGERGRRLSAGIREAYLEFFTEKEGRPRGPWKTAASDVEQLRAEAAELRKEAEQFDREVDQLASLRERIARRERDRSLERAVEERIQAQEAFDRVAQLVGAAETARGAAELARAKRHAEAARWEERERIQDAARRAQDEARRSADAARAAEEERSGFADRLSSLRDALEAAAGRRAAAAASLDAVERRAERERRQAAAKDAARRLSLAREAQELRQSKAAEAAAIRATAKSIAALRKLELAAAEAKARLAAVATLIELRPEPDRSATVAGTAASPALRLVERTEIELGGWGRIVVTPGGEDLNERAAAAERAERRFAAALSELAVADLASAEAALRRREALLGEVAAQAELVKAHAPEGVDALAAALAAAEAELAALQEDDGSELPTLREAKRAVEEAEAALEGAQRAFAEADRSHATLRVKALTEARVADAAAKGAAALAEELEQARRKTPDEALRRALDEADAAVRAAEASAVEATRALQAVDPEAAELRLEAARDAEARLKAEIAADNRQARDLEVALQARGRGDLAERLEHAEAELARAQERLAALEREAGALRVLHEALSAAEREAKESFMAPVRERIQPYLRLLMPAADVVLDESAMEIAALRRGGVDEPFEALSVGAREQLAVLTRLAFADLLVEKGHPAMVILDDALVNADEGRMERMRHILLRAAKRFQILVLTCREEDYRGTGAPIVRLADCVRPALARSA